jgi:hypothetical protein
MDADRDYRSEVLDLRCEIAGLLVQRALLRLALKAYNPDQPRVPSGSPQGGRWTSGGGAGGVADGQTADDGPPLDVPVQLAGDIPQNDPPEIPEERPPTPSERGGIVRQLASGPSNWMYLLTLPQWLHAYLPSIISYNDPPRSLEELQQNVVNPQPGYQIHHMSSRPRLKRMASPDRRSMHRKTSHASQRFGTGTSTLGTSGRTMTSMDCRRANFCAAEAGKIVMRSACTP